MKTNTVASFWETLDLMLSPKWFKSNRLPQRYRFLVHQQTKTLHMVWLSAYHGDFDQPQGLVLRLTASTKPFGDLRPVKLALYLKENRLEKFPNSCDFEVSFLPDEGKLAVDAFTQFCVERMETGSSDAYIWTPRAKERSDQIVASREEMDQRRAERRQRFAA